MIYKIGHGSHGNLKCALIPFDYSMSICQETTMVRENNESRKSAVSYIEMYYMNTLWLLQFGGVIELCQIIDH